MSQPNPFTIEPSHRAPKCKCTILAGRAVVGMAWHEDGKTHARLEMMLTPAELRHVADGLERWQG